jgi:L-lactate dehydrogenase
VFLQLIDPAGFGGRAAFVRETSALAALCRTAPVPPGKPPVRLPGDAARARRARQLSDGVALYPTALPALAPWAERWGIALPEALPLP